MKTNNRKAVDKYRKIHSKRVKERERQYYHAHQQQCLEYANKYHQTICGYLRRLFHNIKKRCTNPKDRSYKYYGGRGIELRFASDEFVNYVINVLKIDPRGLQIDRIDNDKHYEKGNIRFVTAKENANNRRQRR